MRHLPDIVAGLPKLTVLELAGYVDSFGSFPINNTITHLTVRACGKSKCGTDCGVLCGSLMLADLLLAFQQLHTLDMELNTSPGSPLVATNNVFQKLIQQSTEKKRWSAVTTLRVWCDGPCKLWPIGLPEFQQIGGAFRVLRVLKLDHVMKECMHWAKQHRPLLHVVAKVYQKPESAKHPQKAVRD